jgi:thiamine-phosphate pyrophosphorylase
MTKPFIKEPNMRGLYLVTPNWDDTDKLLAVTRQALDAGATLIQYRHKDASPGLREEQAAALLALCRRHGRALIVNDYLALCDRIDADGVHVGGTDVPVRAAREALGPDKIVGASCYGDLALAHSAQDAGASYVAFGGFYPSVVKKYPVTTAPGLVAQAKAVLSVPVVVIGGMTPANARPLVEFGADMVAAISSVYQAPDPAGAVREFGKLFDAA